LARADSSFCQVSLAAAALWAETGSTANNGGASMNEKTTGASSDET
jgi:hypothetical protein